MKRHQRETPSTPRPLTADDLRHVRGRGCGCSSCGCACCRGADKAADAFDGFIRS